jgi:hypothetical protein
MKKTEMKKPKVPTCSGFWILATGYRDAGDATNARIEEDGYVGFALFPCVFLYFRGIELALKSVLVYHDVSESDITKKFSHRLSMLITSAATFVDLSVLGISDDDRELLDRFSENYYDKWFEYPDNFWDASPNRENLKSLAHRVCNSVQIYTKKPMKLRTNQS